jgi:NAD(P)-dependent dehydrogenase (short-subunit alcohol dehydrogenase family)
MNRPVAIITGAAGGIGSELARLLAGRGYDLVLHARRREAINELGAAIRKAHPDTQIKFFSADLAHKADIAALAQAIGASNPRIDILFNNAGRLAGELEQSDSGVELHAQINLLAPFMLMEALRPQLAAARGVVINVSSGSIFMTGPLTVAGLRAPARMTKLTGPYAQSKLALSILTHALAPDYLKQGIRLVSVDPGPNRTPMTAGDGMPRALLLLRALIFRKPAHGAKLLLEAAKDVTAETSGDYLEGGRSKPLPKGARSPALAAEVLHFCRTHAS